MAFPSHFTCKDTIYLRFGIYVMQIIFVHTCLSAAGYIEVEKTFKGKKPCTLCRITPTGLHAFEQYVKALKTYLKPR